MRLTLKLFTADDVGEYSGWRTLFWLTADRWPRRTQSGLGMFSIAMRFRGWKPFIVIGRRGKELVFPKWQPRPWEED